MVLMNALITLASLGIDSFVASLVIGAYGVSRRDAWRCAVAFGACDAAASLAGALWSPQIPEAAALGVYLLCPLLLVRASRSRPLLLYGLPLLLSLDNLYGGTPAAMAPALGASSAVMALLGLGLASFVRDRVFLSRAER
jgi:hypothetical protein